MTADDLIEVARVLWRGARRDPVNNAVMPLIGAALVGWLVYRGYVSWETVRMVVCRDIC